MANAVQAAQQAASAQQKQDEINRAVLMQRFQAGRQGPHMAMAIPVSMAGPVTSLSMLTPMRHAPGMSLAPPTLIHGGNLMRPPPMGLPPGKRDYFFNSLSNRSVTFFLNFILVYFFVSVCTRYGFGYLGVLFKCGDSENCLFSTIYNLTLNKTFSLSVLHTVSNF